ncbi:aromatic acid exporter family protein [Aneurinibacillus sp. BA2021]|nr:aromatic acid exporter family protein [Aneurinibacillus sp. BA2021]
MKIGYRTIKTAIGTTLSIFLAQWLGLQFPTSAGILTILCIQVTKRRSLQNAYARFAACLLGLGIGMAIFTVVGYYALSLLLVILLLLPVLVRLRIQDGFVTASVIILHLYSVRSVSLAFLGNELAVMSIGIGMGLIMNAYMPSMEVKLRSYQKKIEQNFQVILKELAAYLRNHDSAWDGREIIETAELLSEAKGLAVQHVENHLLRNKDSYYYYFEMREEQFELLERMVPLISTLPYVPQGELMADFLEQVSDRVHPGNTAHLFLEKLREMKKEMEQTDLPKTREEFETRANLFYFLQEMERYLLIKHQFRPASSS